MNAIADVEKLIESLPGMEADELRAVHARVTVLLKTGPKNSRASQTNSTPAFAGVMYSALVDQMALRTGVKYPPFSVFQSQPSCQRFLEACQVIEEANGMWFPKQTKAEQASMATLYAGLVLDRLSERGSTLVWGTINYWLENVPGLVDDAFPGYAMAGLLSKVQTMRTSKRR